MRKPCKTSLIALLLAHPVVAPGSEQSSCDFPFVPFWSASGETLRGIGASCSDKTTAMLFYNRAYHANVLEDLRKLSGLEKRGSDEDDVRYHQGRIFIALSEELARIAWLGGDKGIIDDLNAAYDRSIDTLEYAVKGYNVLIGRSAKLDPRKRNQE